MNVRVKLADRDDFFIIKNFIPLFRHYIGEVYNELPNKYGVFSYDDCKTLQELCDKRESWLEKPKELFPFIIFAYEKPVGYIFVSKVQQSVFEKVGYFINALFVVNPVRRKGIASIAIKKVFDIFNGEWELHTSSSDINTPTQGFWKNTLNQYTNGEFIYYIDKTLDGSDKIIFKFSNNKTIS